MQTIAKTTDDATITVVLSTQTSTLNIVSLEAAAASAAQPAVRGRVVTGGLRAVMGTFNYSS